MELSKIHGGEQRLRTSTLARDRPERGEEQENQQGKLHELHSPTPLQEDSTRDDVEAQCDFCTRVKLHVPKEETFPIPMKYIDVTRTTFSSLDVLLEKNIEDYWNVD